LKKIQPLTKPIDTEMNTTLYKQRQSPFFARSLKTVKQDSGSGALSRLETNAETSPTFTNKMSLDGIIDVSLPTIMSPSTVAA
jgi:hypothetical protein